MRNINKILRIIVCIVLTCFIIGSVNVSAQPEKVIVNETYVKDILNDYINSSGINLTNYTLEVNPKAVPVNGTNLVNVFLTPENSTKWSMKFIVNLSAGKVINVTVRSTGNKTSNPVRLTGNEITYVKDIVDNYINSSDINLTNYTLRVVPRAVSVNGTKLVNVFLFPENSTKWLMKFRVDLNAEKVIKDFTKPGKGKLFGKSKQDKNRIKEALKIANSNSELKKQFAMLNFTKIPHIQSYDKIKVHLIFVPMNDYEEVTAKLERKYNLTVVDVNISIEDKKVLKFEIKEMFAEDNAKGTLYFAEDETKGNPDTAESNAEGNIDGSSAGNSEGNTEGNSAGNAGGSNNENNNTGNGRDKINDNAGGSNNANNNTGNGRDKIKDNAGGSNNENNNTGNGRDKINDNSGESNNETNDNTGDDKDKIKDNAGGSNNETNDNTGDDKNKIKDNAGGSNNETNDTGDDKNKIKDNSGGSNNETNDTGDDKNKIKDNAGDDKDKIKDNSGGNEGSNS